MYRNLVLFLLLGPLASAFLDFSSITTEGLSKFLKQMGQAVSDLLPCHYSCSNGGYPIPHPGYRPTANGCGTDTTMFTKELARFIPSVNECCTEHDICYGSCGRAKTDCDTRFRKCLRDSCSTGG